MCGMSGLISILVSFVLFVFLGTSFAVPVNMMESTTVQAEPVRPESPVGIAATIPDAAQGVWSEIQTLRGHEGAVHSVDWSPDGSRLVSGGADGTLRIWDAYTGEQLTVMYGHGADVWSVDWSPDGVRIASGGEDGTVRIWDGFSGVQIWAEQPVANSWVSAVAWAPDGVLLASTHGDGVVRVWNGQAGTMWLELRGHEYSVNAVDWYNNDRLVSAGGSGYPDNTVRLWHTYYRQQLHIFWGHRGEVWSVDVSNGMIASGSTDRTVRLWQADTGAALAVFEGHTGTVTSVDWDITGQYVVSASADSSLRIWDLQTGQALATIFDAHQGWINAATWATNGRIASAGIDGAIRIWSG